MFEKKDSIITDRLRLGDIKTEKDKDKCDEITDHMEIRLKHRKGKNVCHIRYCTVIGVLSTGVMLGLVLLAAQAENALARRLKGNIINKVGIITKNSNPDVKIEHVSVRDKNSNTGDGSISISNVETDHNYEKTNAGNDSKTDVLDTHFLNVNKQIRMDDELVTVTGYSRPKRSAVAEFLKGSNELMSSIGNVKQFMFSLIKPIFKSLGRNQNLPVLEGFASRMLPQTGFQGHMRADLIKQRIKQGFYHQALEILEKNRVKVDVEEFSKLKRKPTAEGRDGYLPDESTADISSPTYRQCKKMVPRIDSLIMERLRSQNSVTTSLMQALYDDTKYHVREELDRAEHNLKKLKQEADIIEAIVSELILEHFWERIIIIIICGFTFGVCVVAVLAIKRCQLQQGKCSEGIIEKIESTLEVVNQVNNTEANRKALTAFDYVDMSRIRSQPSLSPGLDRALVKK